MIIEGDCIEYMKGMEDNSVDLCFADPPYNAKNIGPNQRTYSLGQMQLPLPEYKKFCRDWFKEARRVSNRLLLTPGIANITYYPQPDWVIAWHKPQAVSFNRYGGFNVWEPIFIYGKMAKGKRLNRDFMEVGIINGFGGRTIESEHPCPKPIRLLRRLIDTFSNEGDLILDPFIGSGTTARAAKDLNRRWIGIDINPQYVALSEKRLRQEVLL